MDILIPSKPQLSIFSINHLLRTSHHFHRLYEERVTAFDFLHNIMLIPTSRFHQGTNPARDTPPWTTGFSNQMRFPGD